MKLVIDIDDDIYKHIASNERVYMLDEVNIILIENAIYNGTPLPKGHGDLIDRSELKKEVYTTTEWNGDVHRIIYETSIDDASTIIEAEVDDNDD